MVFPIQESASCDAMAFPTSCNSLSHVLQWPFPHSAMAFPTSCNGFPHVLQWPFPHSATIFPASCNDLLHILQWSFSGVVLSDLGNSRLSTALSALCALPFSLDLFRVFPAIRRSFDELSRHSIRESTTVDGVTSTRTQFQLYIKLCLHPFTEQILFPEVWPKRNH